MIELRCPGRMAARLVDFQGRKALEVKCNSRICRAGPGVVVLHRFDPDTGDLLDTRRYREPSPDAIVQK